MSDLGRDFCFAGIVGSGGAGGGFHWDLARNGFFEHSSRWVDGNGDYSADCRSRYFHDDSLPVGKTFIHHAVRAVYGKKIY